MPSCAEGGVLGVLPGLVAMIQATETVKIVTGAGEPLYGRLLQIDALQMEFNEFRLKKDPACPVCGEAPSIVELIDYEGFCGVPAADEEEEVKERSAAAVQSLQRDGEDFLLLDVRDPAEYERARMEGSVLIPLAELGDRLGEVPRETSLVVYCRSGQRSESAARQLVAAGYGPVTNLLGGLLSWAESVEPGLPVV